VRVIIWFWFVTDGSDGEQDGSGEQTTPEVGGRRPVKKLKEWVVFIQEREDKILFISF
jgi:hypothetical protein